MVAAANNSHRANMLRDKIAMLTPTPDKNARE